MADIWMDVDTALAEVPVNIMPLLDDTDFKTIEGAVAYNAAGMALRWHFVTSAGAYTVTSVTPTTGGNYDWTDQGDSGVYTIEIPASGGASINNDTEGYGWFTGVATGVLPWRGPIIGFRAAAINDSLCDTNTTGLLAPTTAGRTLDVSAGGEAGVDWANVGSPTTTLNLSGTSTKALEPTTAGRTLDVTTTGEAGLDFANVNIPAGAIPALGIVDNGTAQSATGTTLVLRSAAAFADDELIGATIVITGGSAGVGQSRVITDYVSSTDTATVDTWTTTPTGTITYAIFGGSPASASLVPNVNVTQISGDSTAADNLETMLDGTGGQTLSLGALTVSGATTLTGNVSAAAGVTITQSTTNGHGISVTGNGTGNGINSVGGATGNGIRGLGGATSGDGIVAAGQTSGHGLTATGVGTTKHGINAAGGSTTSDGIRATGGGTGNGATFTSGSGATGQGVNITSAATNGSALVCTAAGTGSGISASGGASGRGALLAAGATGTAGLAITGGGTSGAGLTVTTTSGDAIQAIATAGHGMSLTANGTSKHGLVATGGTAGTSDGIKGVAGTGGIDIRGDITANAMVEAYPADGAAPTIAQAMFLTMQSVGEVSVSGTTLTVKKLDGSTTAATYTLDSATTPTSRTRAS